MREATKKVTVNLPETLLKTARSATGLGITETIVEGLRELQKREKRLALRRLKGKLRLDLDLGVTRR